MLYAILVRMNSDNKSEHDVCCLTFFTPVSWPSGSAVPSSDSPSTAARLSFVSLSVASLRAPASRFLFFASAFSTALSLRVHRPSRKMRAVISHLVLIYQLSDGTRGCILTSDDRD